MSKAKEELKCNVFLNKSARRNYLQWLTKNGVNPEVAILLCDYEIGDTIIINKPTPVGRLVGRSARATFSKFDVELFVSDKEIEFIRRHCSYSNYKEVYALLKAL